MTKPLTAMLLGDVTHREFAEAKTWLCEACETVVLQNVTNDAITQVADQQPNWVVIAQSRPGQYAQQSVDQIRTAAPLATIIALLGSLCEGEMRTGHPWQGAIRAYWHQFVERARHNLKCIKANAPSPWSPQGEGVGDMIPRNGRDEDFAGLIVIAAPNCATYESYAAEFQHQGYATLWRHPLDRLVLCGVHHAIWVGSGASPNEMTQLSQFANEVQPAPVTALLNFVRLADVAAAQHAGANSVLAKPIRVSELLSECEL